MAKLNTISALKTALFLLTYCALTACGTKGPLYIPEQRYPQNDTEQDIQKVTPQAAPEAETPKN
jgi:predicted small lipoprotein YifL